MTKIKKKEYDLNIVVVLFVLCIYPLIVRMALVKTSSNELFIYGKDIVNDSFSYVRGVVIFIVSFIGFINLGLNAGVKKQKEKLNRYHLSVGLLFLLITFSFLFSDYKTVAWRGAIDHFEGYYVWVAYLMLFLIAYNTKLNQHKLRTILLFLTGSSCLISIIGIVQNLGINVLNHPILIKVIVPLKYQTMSEDFFYLQYKFAYSTLGNPNYVGSYTALLLPVIFSLYIQETKKVIKYALLLALLLNTWFLTVSFSEAGITAAIFAAIYVVVLIVKKSDGIKKKNTLLGVLVFASTMVLSSRLNIASLTASKTFWVMVIGSAIIAVLVAFVQNKLIVKRNMQIFLITIAVIVITGIVALYFSNDVVEYNKGIHFKEITLNDNILYMSILDENEKFLEIKLDNQGPLKLIADDKEYLLKDESNEMLFKSYPMNLFDLTIESDKEFRKINFPKLDMKFAINNKTLYYVNGAGFLKNSLEPPNVLKIFKDENIGTDRGYIWNRTFPVLLKSIVIGQGSDSYPIVFSQDDIGGKFNIGMKTSLIVDKPHNAYLQFWISHGLIALIVCGYLAVSAIVPSDNGNTEVEENKLFIVGIRGAVLGFLMVSLFNDTVVYVTPIFVVLLGILLSLKHKNQLQNYM